MSKEDRKKKLEESSDTDSSGPVDKTPAAKKAKTDSSSASKGKDDEEPSWDLGKQRFVKVRTFKGQIYVDIREFYDAGGTLKPGKKGISLSTVQWQKLKGIIDEVDEAVKNA